VFVGRFIDEVLKAVERKLYNKQATVSTSGGRPKVE